MTKQLLILLHCCFCCYLALAQNAPKREFRGAWIATYTNIDWPNKTQTPAQQQAAFITIANHHKATGLTALFIEVRSQCDAMYASSIEPWSADLTGTQGNAPNPYWDPMQFMIQECHKRGIEFHAWLNPYRAVGNTGNLPNFSPGHVAKQHPEWLLTQGTQKILDPGIPAVRDYIIKVIADIVNRYDVDGIHFDDYFYPSPPGSGVTPFNDDSSYAADPRGFTVRADWRRDNVNLLIKRVYDTIKLIKPWVKFGVSPSGIYRNSTNPAVGSATSGLEHYTSLYADTRKWLQEGWIDYLCPQVYWYIGQAGADYKVVVPWWNNNAYGRHIYIGMAGYKVNDAAYGVNWANPSMIPNEIRLNRSLSNVYGEAIYNTNSLRSTTKLGFRDSLRLFFYNKPALLPNMPWRDSLAPAPATHLTAVAHAGDSVVLHWVHPGDTNEMNKAKQFVIYRSESAAIDTSLAENILAITDTAIGSYTDTTILPNTTYYYTVTATDRFHNESAVSNTVSTLPPVITCLPDTMLAADASCAVNLPDFTPHIQVQASSPVTITQTPVAGSAINGKQATVITIIAADAAGNADTCSFTVTTIDTLAPVIANAAAAPAELWPPDHQLHNVTVNYNSTDNCGAVSNAITITCNETATGNSLPNWVIVDAHHVQLRAEHNRLGHERIYTITITATDSSGNATTQQVTVRVPRFPGNEEGHLTVKVFPNPSRYQFAILTLSTSPQPVAITVTDNTGRVVETRHGLPATGLLYIGARYRPGVYYLQVKQGNNKEVIQLVKL
jgi:uncharacterized lipoprotein YddW (UPF0748 family)